MKDFLIRSSVYNKKNGVIPKNQPYNKEKKVSKELG